MKKRSPDLELMTMRRIVGMLERLPKKQRKRVVSYVVDRYYFGKSDELDQDMDEDEYTDADDYEDEDEDEGEDPDEEEGEEDEGG